MNVYVNIHSAKNGKGMILQCFSEISSQANKKLPKEIYNLLEALGNTFISCIHCSSLKLWGIFLFNASHTFGIE